MYDDNPREWEGNVGTMWCGHRRYSLGDPGNPYTEARSRGEFEHLVMTEQWPVVMLPLYLYDHGGLAISTKSWIGRAHHAEWDSGYVGVIFATRERVRELFEWKYMTRSRIERITRMLEAEVDIYDKYLRGETYHDDEEEDV